jgi:hypothetical protein
MQPCEVCGGMGVDAAGYCTQCRTYRGVPQQYPQGQQPYGGAPASGAPYGGGAPGSGAPYGAPASGQPYQAPASGQPYGGAPASDGGYLPTSGAPYPYATSGAGAGYQQQQPGYPAQYPQYAPPAAPAPAPPGKSRGFTVPLIALSATLVVIVVAIVVVAIVRSGSKKPVAEPSTQPSASALVDECVVGTWNITSDEEDVVMDQVGKVRFTGKGGEAKLKADGTGTIDYDKNGPAKFTATYKDQPIELTVTGTVTFDYRTNNGAVSYSNMKAHGNLAMTVGGVASTSLPLEVDDTPAKYTCSGDSLELDATLQTVKYTRTSHDT